VATVQVIAQLAVGDRVMLLTHHFIEVMGMQRVGCGQSPLTIWVTICQGSGNGRPFACAVNGVVCGLP
jgi:hypothetical protein